MVHFNLNLKWCVVLLSSVPASFGIITSCPKDMYYNTVSHVCDPCPPECTADSSSAKACEEFASECLVIRSTAVTKTETTGPENSSKTAKVPGGASSNGGSLKTGAVVGSAIVLVVVLGCGLFASRRRLCGIFSRLRSNHPAYRPPGHWTSSNEAAARQPFNPSQMGQVSTAGLTPQFDTPAAAETQNGFKVENGSQLQNSTSQGCRRIRNTPPEVLES